MTKIVTIILNKFLLYNKLIFIFQNSQNIQKKKNKAVFLWCILTIDKIQDKWYNYIKL
jgi:hypothetical protein